MLRSEQRADRLQLRADQLGRRSARQLGVVISLARMAELRTIIAASELPDTIRKVGKVGLSADAYEIKFDVEMLVAVYDRRGQSIAMFLLPDAPGITRTIPTNV
ncbi:hypothetical protein FHT00_003468 [Sphingomonas insulae]|nr:hypothetical protein [Sphingomonas insulae]NIJ31488.1 hypothetical protein [Sphingomonas insulae]